MRDPPWKSCRHSPEEEQYSFVKGYPSQPFSKFWDAQTPLIEPKGLKCAPVVDDQIIEPPWKNW
jgi:hypothetical protein